MNASLKTMGYRSKAERTAEVRLVGKQAGLTKRQIQVMVACVGRVMGDLQDCANAREAAVSAIRAASTNDWHKRQARTSKQANVGGRLVSRPKKN